VANRYAARVRETQKDIAKRFIIITFIPYNEAQERAKESQDKMDRTYNNIHESHETINFQIE
jgi:hypothetical protein